jgi:hypothetical protein
MQNLILLGRVIVSREVIEQKREIWVEVLGFSTFQLTFLVDGRYSTYGSILIGCIGCKI